ncbi:MAG TPA: glycosyltransferase family 4 protein [Acidimicrobiales bacterium]|jgi:glycosyltransferase involved in cell wall biosynthesis
MKVLVVGTGGSIVSGISTAADQMATILPRLGHSADRLNAGERMRTKSNALNLENVRAVLFDAVAVAHRTRRQSADVVWIHTFGVPALPALRALAIVLGARLGGAPAVVQFHAFGLEQMLDGCGWSLRFALRAVTALSGASVVLHEGAASALRRVVGRSPIHVLANWVDVPEKLKPLPPRPPLRLVFVGGLVRRKGVRQLIDAMKLLEDTPAELRLVGGPGEDGPVALEQLQVAARALVASGRVTFTGEQDTDGVRSELEAGHLLVLPSEAEGMPMAMLEAMAVGRPVLVTNAGNMKSVVEETGCGWVMPDGKPETIANYLRSINGASGAIEAASSSAGRAAADRYSARARKDDIEAILTSVLTAS